MTLWPAIWSALAASCSALAALVLLFLHLRNARDSVRPDLVLAEPMLNPPEKEDGMWFLIFEGLRNCGRGPALNIFAYAHKSLGCEALIFDDGGYGPGIGAFSFVAPGDKCDRRFRIWFKPRWMGEGDSRAGFATAVIRFHAWDLHGRQHVVEYMYSVMGAGGRWKVQLGGRYPWVRSKLRLYLLVRWERLMQRAPEAWKKFADRWERASREPP